MLKTNNHTKYVIYKFVAHINNISPGKNSNITQLNIFFVN